MFLVLFIVLCLQFNYILICICYTILLWISFWHGGLLMFIKTISFKGVWSAMSVNLRVKLVYTFTFVVNKGLLKTTPFYKFFQIISLYDPMISYACFKSKQLINFYQFVPIVSIGIASRPVKVFKREIINLRSWKRVTDQHVIAIFQLVLLTEQSNRLCIILCDCSTLLCLK